MPVKDSMMLDPIRGKITDTVSDTLELFERHKIRCVPVVDDDDKLVGVFNFHYLLMELLPVVIEMADEAKRFRNLNISLDHLDGQAPWVARRLKFMLPKTLGEVMLKNPVVLHPDTTHREAIRLIVEHGSPLPVVDEETGRLVGLMSSQNCVSALLKMKTDMKRGKSAEEIAE